MCPHELFLILRSSKIPSTSLVKFGREIDAEEEEGEEGFDGKFLTYVVILIQGERVGVEKKGNIGTSESVYNRVKWDPAFDPEDFTIVYEDRFIGTRTRYLFSLWRLTGQEWKKFHSWTSERYHVPI